MVKHTQTIPHQTANELSECVWSFCGIGTYRFKSLKALQAGAIFDKSYATMWSGLCDETASVPYDKAKSIHYQTLSEKDTTWKVDINNLSVRSL